MRIQVKVIELWANSLD